jgi:hypothetical protein
MGLKALLALRMEGLLRIFIPFKNLSPSARFKLENLGSNGKQANH